MKLVLWQPQHGQTKRGRPRTTYTHTLLENTSFATIGETRLTMLDQSDWRGRIHDASASTRANSCDLGPFVDCDVGDIVLLFNAYYLIKLSLFLPCDCSICGL